MTSLKVNLCDIKKITETLYSDSYFCLLRLKNNSSKSKEDIRNLIRQTEFHCLIQNANKKSTEELKFQFILEYYSIVDREKQDDLLPVIVDDDDTNDDLNLKNKFNSLNEMFEAQNASQLCMELVQQSLNLYLKIPSENNGNDHSIVNNFFNNEKGLFSTSLSEKSKSKKKDLLLNESTLFYNQSDRETDWRNHKYIGSNISSSPIKKGSPLKQKVTLFSENSLKRRANESDIYTCRSPKRQNNKQTDTKTPNISKNSFLTASSRYKNPLKKANDNYEENGSHASQSNSNYGPKLKKHPTLKIFEEKIVNIILNEIMDFSPDIKWSDIAGLEFVKSTVQEIVIWPLLRPDIFTGLRAPPRGILLFGPPGTGKTLIGKCIATESNSTFFCISASSLASKWVGESEQLVRALFAVAQLHQPAVIFIDEIDSLLSQRSDQEQDHTRKLKTEFLVQFDGAKTSSERRVLIVGATNRPHELDEAARRRFVKRLYVPLPEKSARLQIVEKLLLTHQHGLSKEDLNRICEETDGYSGSDVTHLCKEAAMGPIRSIGPDQIKTVCLDQVRPIELKDFLDALKQVRASVAQEDLNYYLDWNNKFGSFSQ